LPGKKAGLRRIKAGLFPAASEIRLRPPRPVAFARTVFVCHGTAAGIPAAPALPAPRHAEKPARYPIRMRAKKNLTSFFNFCILIFDDPNCCRLEFEFGCLYGESG
jgi:hypothetical protein